MERLVRISQVGQRRKLVVICNVTVGGSGVNVGWNIIVTRKVELHISGGKNKMEYGIFPHKYSTKDKTQCAK